jgi:hypothetical protein
MPTFETWERTTLDKFAYDAYAALQQKDEQIQQLQCDLKDAIEAYRELMRRGESQPCQ